MNDITLAARVNELVERMYSGYLAGDRAAIDSLLDPALTMFDSEHPTLISGMDELNAVRAARGTAVLIETALTASHFTARRIGSVISATWWLRVDAVDSNGTPVTPEIVRNSAVLLDSGGPLRIIQLHEDVYFNHSAAPQGGTKQPQ